MKVKNSRKKFMESQECVILASQFEKVFSNKICFMVMPPQNIEVLHSIKITFE